MLETGVRAAELLFRAARHEIHPTVSLRKAPCILPPENSQTTDGPMSEVLAEARSVEALPGVLSASVFPVQPWLDVADVGVSAVVVGDGPLADAKAHANKLVRLLWERRRRFEVPLVAPDEAVRRALASPNGPVLLVDSADGTSSGSPGDSTALLHPLLQARPSALALTTVVDPDAVAACARAGVGAAIELSIGGRRDPARHRPAVARGVVERLGGGLFTFSAGVGTGLTADMGQTAVLRVAGLRVVLMEKAVPCYDPALYRSVGLKPSEAHVVVVKSPTNFRWTYDGIAREALYVDAPGASSPRLASLPYRNVIRPLYPLDDLAWGGE
jgi:microcystin degradation protein MlrC